MADLVGGLATLSCSLFAGAAVYINLVEHPARLSCGTEVALRQWAPSYKRATVMQVPLAVMATVAGLAVWLRGDGTAWLLGALLIASVIPFTLLVILPTNHRLLEPDRDGSVAETKRLLVLWGRLHAVRSVLAVAATVVYFRALLAGSR